MAVITAKKLTDFFIRKSDKGEVLFADGQTGMRCRLGLCIRTIWESPNGFVPQPEKHIFAVSSGRLADFGVAYVTSETRSIDPDLPGKPVMVDFLEIGGVFYYTIIFEKKERPRALEKRNWN
ncbi:MAG: hypothetical protein V4439_02225 [Patescibacteria group bacterium]